MLTLLMFLAVQFVWGMWSIKSYSRHGLNGGWEYLTYLYTTINTFLMPIFIAVLASRISDLEHKGSAFKLLLTEAPANRIYASKFFCCAIFITIVAAVQLAEISLIGLLFQFPQAYPAGIITSHGVRMLAASLPILALQLGISMLAPNQMFALVTGLAGGFIGIMSLFFSDNVSKLVLWSYYSHLSAITPVFSEKSMLFELRPIPSGSLAVVLIAGLLIFLCGSILFSKKEW